MKRLGHGILICLLSATLLPAQSGGTRWQRGARTVRDLELFHSTHAINLNTAETLAKGDLEFEVSHRFLPPITDGAESLYGVDGPVNMRLALGYAVSRRLLITLGRSNVADNTDLFIKWKAGQIRHSRFPMLVALRAGASYNGQLLGPIAGESRRLQPFVQLVVNTLIRNRVGIGLVPGYVRNAHIYCSSCQYSFTIGNYIQLYLSPNWSLLAEWIPTVTGWRQNHNTVALGIEIETGGHFFKILVSNNSHINTVQTHSGADLDFASGDWRLGFMITRLLKL